MTLFTFQPRRLESALKQLIIEHPLTVQDLANPQRIQERFPNLLAELRQRFKATQEQDLSDFAARLSALERPLIPRFHLDREEPIRLKMLQLLRVSPDLADVDTLLSAFNHYANTAFEGGQLAQILLLLFPSPGPIRHEWRMLLTCRVNRSVDEFNPQAIRNIVDIGMNIPIFLEKLQISPESNLGAGLEQSVLDAGPSAWKFHGNKTALRAFRRAALPARVNALLIGYQACARQGHEQRAAHLLAQSALSLILDDKLLIQTLREKHAHVWLWIQELRLRAFFDLDVGEGNERFDFWRRYLNKVQELHINTTEGRLFMTFDQVVIIEFIQTGNATYVYNKTDGENLINLDIRQPSRKHQSFKNTDIAIKRWIHKSGWQSNFKYELSKLNIDQRGPRM